MKRIGTQMRIRRIGIVLASLAFSLAATIAVSEEEGVAEKCILVGLPITDQALEDGPEDVHTFFHQWDPFLGKSVMFTWQQPPIATRFSGANGRGYAEHVIEFLPGITLTIKASSDLVIGSRECTYRSLEDLSTGASG